MFSQPRICYESVRNHLLGQRRISMNNTTEPQPSLKDRFLVQLKKRATPKFVMRVLVLMMAGKIVRGSGD